jgi:DNA-binding response OmpR family regulator
MSLETRVLIVEDDPQVARVLSRQLESEGYTVRSTRCAEDAIQLAGSERFQLILTDINLPGMSGFEAIGPLKRAGGAPVLVMTGRADREFTEDVVLLGAIGLIAKPLEFETLRGFLSGLYRPLDEPLSPSNAFLTRELSSES